MSAVRLIVAAVLALMVVGTVPAWTASRAAMDVRGRWRPWNRPHVDSTARLSAAQRQAFAGALTRLAEPFRRLPPLNPPMGFEVAPYRTIEGGRPITGRMWLAWYAYYRTCSACPHQVDTHFRASIWVYVNRAEVLFEPGHDIVAEDEGGTLYQEPRRVADLAGFPQYEVGGRRYPALVITRQPVPILVPASQARVIRARIREVAREAARYERGRNPEWAARARATQRALEAELAALSPSERAAPAYCCGGPRPSGLAAPDDRGARRVVAINPALMDRGRPPGAFQVLVVEGRPPRNPDDPLQPTFHAVWATVDWRAFLGMLTGR